MGHGNARLTVHGRRLIVQRVRFEGVPVAHVAKAMGISRQCAHRWLARWDAEGDAGLEDRSCRPHRSPNRTPAEVEARVVATRHRLREGPDRLAPEVGVPARTISRILRRHDVAYLRDCDPMTGEVIRASKTTAVRYEPRRAARAERLKCGAPVPGPAWPGVFVLQPKRSLITTSAKNEG